MRVVCASLTCLSSFRLRRLFGLPQRCPMVRATAGRGQFRESLRNRLRSTRQPLPLTTALGSVNASCAMNSAIVKPTPATTPEHHEMPRGEAYG